MKEEKRVKEKNKKVSSTGKKEEENCLQSLSFLSLFFAQDHDETRSDREAKRERKKKLKKMRKRELEFFFSFWGSERKGVKTF